MKILHLIHQFYPEFRTGTEKFVYNSALMAQRSGNKVKVVTYSFYEDSFYDQEFDGILYRAFVFEDIPIIAFKHKHQPLNLHIALEDEFLHNFTKKILDDESTDIIHVGHPMRVHEFIKVANEQNIPYIVTLTDFFMICPKVILAPNNYTLCSGPKKVSACLTLCGEFTEKFLMHRMDLAENILVHAKQVISPSKFVASIFNQEFRDLNIQIINHGMRYKYIKQNHRIYNKRDHLVFGYASSLAYHKGVHVLIKAFSCLENKDVELRIYGSGEKDYVDYLKNISDKDNRITFCGTFLPEQLGEIFSTMDVMVVPSVCYENYPLVLHEALASNVPVIASNLGGMVEKIKDGLNGFTFETGSSKDLAKKMRMMIDNPEILNKMKEYIKKKMIIPTVEQEAYKYFKIYKNM